MLEQSGNPVCT